MTWEIQPLQEPTGDGKWVNRRIEWDGQIWPTVDGQPYYVNTTQNLYRPRSGRVLAPVTLRAVSQRAADASKNVSEWWAVEKRNSVIYTDDLGETWHLSPGCVTPGFTWKASAPACRWRPWTAAACGTRPGPATTSPAAAM